jgi:hypothetical protein
MRSSLRLLSILSVLSMILSACSALATPSAGQSIPGLPSTLAAQTLTAKQGQYSPFLNTPTPPAIAKQASMVQAVAVETQPAPLQLVLTPTRRRIQTNEESAKSCKDAAEFVEDISVPDNSRMRPLQRFTKTWRFKNVGTCTWTPEYRLEYVWGDKLTPVDTMPIGQTVEPGETVDISVALMAPKMENYYQCNWMFADEQGNQFGTGYRANGFFWVAIDVSAGGGGAGGVGACGGGG